MRYFVLPAARVFTAIACLALLGNVASLRAADHSDPEDFHIELTGAVWILNPRGSIQAGTTPIDLRGDVGIEKDRPTFVGKLVVKPGRKHRIIVEGTPYELEGDQQLTRTIRYEGQTFTVTDRVRSRATLGYVFGVYQYDFLSRRAGHLGIQIGGAYLDATGRLEAVQSGVTASKSQKVGIPLIGAEFRVSPIPHHSIFEINGEVRGVPLGDYGHYLQSSINAGIRLGLFTIEGGYRFLDADLHDTSVNRNGVAPQFRGPTAGLVFRY